jgi:hypothetical protein
MNYKFILKSKMETFRQKQPDKIEFARHLARLQELQSLREETNLWRESVDLHIDIGKPYLPIIGLSDFHLGHEGVNMERLTDYLNFLRDYPVLSIVLGDMVDMFAPMKHPHGMLKDVIPPDDQVMLAQQFFTTFKDKIIASVQTKSHDGWSKELTGVDVQRLMVEDLGIPLLEGGGIVNLTVNNQKYKILCFHEIARYNSSLNVLNANRRMLEVHKDADIVLSAHGHIGAMGKFVQREGMPYLIRCGTFKTEDEFGTQRGLVPKPQVFFPTIFFDGRKHNIEVIENLEASREMIDLIEEHYKRLAIAHLGV